MPGPRILRIVRPYQTLDDFVAAEGWSVNKKGMLLIGQDAMDPDSVVRFEVALESGERVMRAEARVVEYSESRDDRPAGLKVRFKRFDAGTKALIERAVSESQPPPAVDESTQAEAPPPRPPMVSLVDNELDEEPIVIDVESSPSATSLLEGGREDDTGVRTRERKEIEAPPNREELLERLRERARRVSEAQVEFVDEQTG